MGCAPATDSRAQKTAQAFAKILQIGGVNYAVLGENEQCTGDSARRAGNEFLFNELAMANVEMLNEVAPKRIVTTCPHCLHTLKNEYPAFGGNYQVIHHTQLIEELIASGNLHFDPPAMESVAFHDPCYLGRQNQIITQPRAVLKQVNQSLLEMEHFGRQSFCCGAGGAQMWKEEEHGKQRVNAARFHHRRSGFGCGLPILHDYADRCFKSGEQPDASRGYCGDRGEGNPGLGFSANSGDLERARRSFSIAINRS